MSTPTHSSNVSPQQSRTGIIAAVKTPLGLSSLVVLVLEGLFMFELSSSRENRYIPEDQRFLIIVVLIAGLFGLVILAWLFQKSRGARQDFYFSGLVTTSKGLPVPGATVTLWKNDQQVGTPKQTLMMGDTGGFVLPVDDKDEVKVKVEKPGPAGNESREKWLILPGYQHKFNVEF